jgi:hypothetical protein
MIMEFCSIDEIRARGIGRALAGAAAFDALVGAAQ